MFIDTHLHLADSQYEPDRDAVIERALAAKVTTLIEIAESPDVWDAAISLADQHSFIYASLGIHPHYAHEYGPKEWPAVEKRFRDLLQHPKAVAIGECGLDYFRMRNTREQQDFLFQKQLELARELDKPVVIHCRNDQSLDTSAQAAVQATLQDFFPATSLSVECPRPAGVIHCFSGTWPDAQACMAHGFLLGIDAPVTYPSAKALQQIVLRMPLERLVLETDAPYLPPQALRGKRNEPANIPAIAEAVGAIKRKTTEDVGRRTTLNARQLFRLPLA